MDFRGNKVVIKVELRSIIDVNNFTQVGHFNDLGDLGFNDQLGSWQCIEDTCANNDSIEDRRGNTCSSTYDYQPDLCGKMDTHNFTASDLCCACKDHGLGVCATMDAILIAGELPIRSPDPRKPCFFPFKYEGTKYD